MNRVQLDEVCARKVSQPELVESLQRLVKLAALSDSGQTGVAAQIRVVAEFGKKRTLRTRTIDQQGRKSQTSGYWSRSPRVCFHRDQMGLTDVVWFDR